MPLAVDYPIFICCGEPSGDLYASLLVDDLNKSGNAGKVHAIGGERLRQAGADVLIDCRELLACGFTDGLFASATNFAIYRRIARLLRGIQPKTFIAVAYPGLNLFLCRRAKKSRIKTIYLMPPQIWAWGRFRKYFIKKWVDTAVSFLPFESEYLTRLGINVVTMKNPLAGLAARYRRADFRKRIGLMPGSRPAMIRRNLPVIDQVVTGLKKNRPEVEFVLILPPAVGRWPSQLPAVWNYPTGRDHYQTMVDCDLLITCSGTASLEAAFLNVPQVFFHRPAFIDWHLGRHLIRLQEFNLANLYFGRKIVPSFIGRDVKRLAKSVLAKIADLTPLVRTGNR